MGDEYQRSLRMANTVELTSNELLLANYLTLLPVQISSVKLTDRSTNLRGLEYE